MPSPESPHVDWKQALADATARGAAGDPTGALEVIIGRLRPHPRCPEHADSRLEALCDRLQAGEADTRAALGRWIRAALAGVRSTETLVEAGVPGDRGFLDEAGLRLGRRLLPEVVPADTLRGLVRTLFARGDDHRWLAAIAPDTWQRFLSLVGITAETVEGITAELAAALRILAHHVASLGLSPGITRLLPEVDDPDSPFLALSDTVLRYVRSFDNDVTGDEEPLLDEALAVLGRCRELVHRLRAEKHRFGTSLRLTGLTRRLLAQIDRLDLLLHLTEPVERDFPSCARRLAVTLVEAEDTRDHLRPHLRASADLLAFQVVEHAARKGSRYITDTAGEYSRFLLSSLGGGVLVAIFALFKVLLDAVGAAPAVEALIFSTNYALCFVLIALCGATLATKQPAMTANTLARTMEPRAGRHDVDGLADLIVRVHRSQFVSFVGNLGAALPLGIALAWALVELSGAPVAGPEKARKMLADLHPWESGSLAYAAIAGVFLSTAGLVSGWLDNRNLYRRLAERIGAHPLLCRVVGPHRAVRIGDFAGRKLGVLGGNVYLGFCLGTAGTIGMVLGIPFDIRHIAFASAHFGMALHTLGLSLPLDYILQIALGVALIGLVNFFVSFGLTLLVALTARRFTFREGRALTGAVLRRFLRRPWAFFLPPLRSRPPAARPTGEPG